VLDAKLAEVKEEMAEIRAFVNMTASAAGKSLNAAKHLKIVQ
jgi:hypothetical protein